MENHIETNFREIQKILDSCIAHDYKTKVDALFLKREYLTQAQLKDYLRQEIFRVTENIVAIQQKYRVVRNIVLDMDIPDFSPGFNVNLMADLYLCPHLNLRFSPGIFFGNKVVKFRETATQEYRTQDIKSNYIVVPLELKFSALRCNNFRPYLIGGVMGTADVSKKRNDLLKLNTFDGYLTIGLGCDFYLPYFKLIPELKFCFGLTDVINRKRNDLRDLADIKFTQSLKKATSNMVILSFYFE